MTEQHSTPTGDLSDVECVIHIGLPRTGTTWLQNHLFARDVGLFWTLEEMKKDSTWRIVRVNGLSFDPEPVRAYYRTVVDGMPNGRRPAISNERLSGVALSGGYDSREIADRLKSVFPRARIIMGIREQVDMIRSIYNNYLIAGGMRTLEKYLEPPLLAYRLPHFQYDFLAYDKLAAYYRSLFGDDRVLLLPVELFAADPADYLRRILEFCSIEADREFPCSAREKTSISPALYPLLRRINPFTKEDPANGYSCLAVNRTRPYVLRAVRSTDARLPDAWRRRAKEKLVARIQERVGDRYAECNQRLQAMTPIDLSRLSYF